MIRDVRCYYNCGREGPSDTCKCGINPKYRPHAQKENAPPSRPKASDAPEGSQHDRRIIA
jgi:hypothetical protein